METHARDERDQSICHDARNVSLQCVVLAILAPAGADIESFIEFLEQPRDIGRIVLQIAVHRNDDIAAREIEAGHHRSGLTKVAPQVDDFYERIAGGDFVENALAFVGASIIDQDQLPFAARRRHRLADARVECAQISSFVADRHGDGNHQRAAKVKPRRRSAKREVTNPIP